MGSKGVTVDVKERAWTTGIEFDNPEPSRQAQRT